MKIIYETKGKCCSLQQSYVRHDANDDDLYEDDVECKSKMQFIHTVVPWRHIIKDYWESKGLEIEEMEIR